MFFLLLVVAFAIWGVGDMVRVWFAGENYAAKVAGYRISMPQFQQAYQREMAEDIRSQQALRRRGLPEEQAAAIAFLASDDASFITGQVINCSGGQS